MHVEEECFALNLKKSVAWTLEQDERTDRRKNSEDAPSIALSS